MKKTFCLLLTCCILFSLFPIVQAATFIPSPPTGFRAEALSCTTFRLSWNAVKGASGYALYYLYGKEPVLITETTATSTIDSGQPESTCTYQVRSFSTQGGKRHYSAFSKSLVATLPTAGPDGLSASLQSNGTIKISWLQKADANGYVLYRSANEYTGYQAIKTLTNNAYTDLNPPLIGGLYYKLRSYDTINGKKQYSGYSDPVFVSDQLFSPAQLNANGMTTNSIVLSWTQADSAVGYGIYTSTNQNGPFHFLTNTTQTYYRHTGLTANKVYYYKIRSYYEKNTVKYYGEYSRSFGAKTLRTKKNQQNILFVGNSLTSVPMVDSQFRLLAQSQHKDVSVYSEIIGGSILAQHYPVLSANAWLEMNKDFDIVILQEGLFMAPDTHEMVLKIQKLFPSTTKFYFYLPNAVYQRNIIMQLKDIPNLTCINVAYAQDYLIKNKMNTYMDLHQMDVIHPNDAFGYMAACTVYSALYKTTCIGLPDRVNNQPLFTSDDQEKMKSNLQKAAHAAYGKTFDDFIPGRIKFLDDYCYTIINE